MRRLIQTLLVPKVTSDRYTLRAGYSEKIWSI